MMFKTKTVPTWLTIYPVLLYISTWLTIYPVTQWGESLKKVQLQRAPTVYSRALTVRSVTSFIYTSTYKRVLWSPPFYNWGNWGTERLNDSKNCSYSESQNLNSVTGFRVSSYLQFWRLIMLTLTFAFQRQVYARQTLAVMHSIRKATPENTLLGLTSPP